jgi:adenosylcobinamide kinase/adenosylcobinamide-phosphate guanylyltransferase
LALKLAGDRARKVAFVATCEPGDREMVKRIALHKKVRPAQWKTFDCPTDVAMLLNRIGNKHEIIVIDCLTLLVSNLLLKDFTFKSIEKEISRILSALEKIKAQSIIVSNEVGLGIVPTSKLGRDFRDIAGRLNQIVAARAEEVIFMVAGLAWRIK